MRWLRPALFCAALASRGATIDPRVAEAIDLHLAALGGSERIQALRGYAATGHVRTDGQVLTFHVSAARPNRLRLEYLFPDGMLVQATDGKSPPWEWSARVQPPLNRLLGHTAAEALLDTANFDDALISAAARHDTIEYAGEARFDTRGVIKLLVTANLSRSFLLLLDSETYYLVARVETRVAADGTATQIVTRYRDFRPVGGVLIPHAVTVSADGHVTEEAELDELRANPPLGEEAFARPSN